MFGMGFTEILLIAIVAILFLGPDKLPGAMVEIAKFIKGAKKAITSAKESIDSEINISELKEEALSYKAKLDSATEELQGFKNLNSTAERSMKDKFASLTQIEESPVATQVEPKQKEIEFKKKTVKESSIKEVKNENGEK
jgi:sec-independent protein translocase protein TatB